MNGVVFTSFLFLAGFGILLIATSVYSCNELVCASVVSKCMLTQSCKCDLRNCSCCKECFNCLNYLYSECCSCVDLCPKPNETRSLSSKKSHIVDFEGVPGLFESLTGAPDDEGRWTTFTFPVDFDRALAGPKLEKDVKYYLRSNENGMEELLNRERENIVTVNCTVAYLTQCLSWNKCREICISMGSTSCRWFHDGCCECVGSTCINYGINESRCSECPESKDDIFDAEEVANEDDLDYGDGVGPLDTSIDTNF